MGSVGKAGEGGEWRLGLADDARFCKRQPSTHLGFSLTLPGTHPPDTTHGWLSGSVPRKIISCCTAPPPRHVAQPGTPPAQPTRSLFTNATTAAGRQDVCRCGEAKGAPPIRRCFPLLAPPDPVAFAGRGRGSVPWPARLNTCQACVSSLLCSGAAAIRTGLCHVGRTNAGEHVRAQTIAYGVAAQLRWGARRQPLRGLARSFISADSHADGAGCCLARPQAAMENYRPNPRTSAPSGARSFEPGKTSSDKQSVSYQLRARLRMLQLAALYER